MLKSSWWPFQFKVAGFILKQDIFNRNTKTSWALVHSNPFVESCLPCARPVLGASVSEWHIRPQDGCHRAEAGWRVPMPSSWRDDSEGKWMWPPFLTQAKATQASLQCGTEGLSPATLIPMILEQNPPTLRLLRELYNEGSEQLPHPGWCKAAFC